MIGLKKGNAIEEENKKLRRFRRQSEKILSVGNQVQEVRKQRNYWPSTPTQEAKKLEEIKPNDWLEEDKVVEKKE